MVERGCGVSEKKAKPKQREHKTGKTNGYGYDTDGESYWIAPCYSDSFAKIQDERNGMKALIDTLNDDFARRHTALAARSRELWKTVSADLGINSDEDWTFHDGRIFRKPKQTPDTKAQTP